MNLSPRRPEAEMNSFVCCLNLLVCLSSETKNEQQEPEPLALFSKPKFPSDNWGHEKSTKECLLRVFASRGLGAGT